MQHFTQVMWYRPRPFYAFFFVSFWDIAHMHFADMFECVPNFIKITWPRLHNISRFLFVHFWEIVHMQPCVKFKVYSFTHFGDMFEGMPNFIKISQAAFLVNLFFFCFGLPKLSTVPNIKYLLLFYVSPLSRVALWGRLLNFFVWGHTANVITCFKFQIDCLKAFGTTATQNLLFPIDFDRHPYNSVTHYRATLW